MKSTVFPQLVREKWRDIRDHLRVNHYFLSFFVSFDIMDIKEVESIMKVNNKTI